jgi:polyisoprenyl-teichoic acid--peptidoglycan teichoic acid transferase
MAIAPDRAAKIRFRRAVALMVMTLLLPGSAQLVAGRREVGRIALRVWAGLVSVGLLTLLLAWLWHGLLFSLASSPLVLWMIRIVLMAVAVGWAALFVDAWRIGQPLTLMRNQRLAVVGINGVLCFSVAGTLLFGAHLVGVQRDFMVAMFGDGTVKGASDGRYNVLLMGGDSGAGRWGLRPDSLTVASIDARTGRTVLVGLPRNLQDFRFAEGSVMDEQFPDGFDCDDCYLNGVATWAQDNTELFGKSRTPGVDATIQAVEGITGLEISYWAMVNLRGFRDLVDAVGGVTLTVRDRIPVGLPHDPFYSHIEPGTRKLNGFHTLWFARARDGSDDYSRMARQKCVMTAMLQQVSPQTMLRNFSNIAQASSDMVSTNIPAGEVGEFVDLALKAKAQPVSTLSLVPPLVNTGNPDIPVVQDKVAEAIDRSEGDFEAEAPAPSKAEKPKRDKPKPAPVVTGGSVGSLSQGYVANQTEDVAAAC